jgi:hypothetical protein
MRDDNRLQLKLRKSDQESLMQIPRGGLWQVRVVLRALPSLRFVGWGSAAQRSLVSWTLRRRRRVTSGSATWKPAWIDPCTTAGVRRQALTES